MVLILDGCRLEKCISVLNGKNFKLFFASVVQFEQCRQEDEMEKKSRKCKKFTLDTRTIRILFQRYEILYFVAVATVPVRLYDATFTTASFVCRNKRHSGVANHERRIHPKDDVQKCDNTSHNHKHKNTAFCCFKQFCALDSSYQQQIATTFVLCTTGSTCISISILKYLLYD